MKFNRILTILVIAFSSLTAVAGYHETRGLEGLKKFNCSLSVRNSEYLENNTVVTAVLAPDKATATALYLLKMRANVSNDPIVIQSSEDPIKSEFGFVTEVDCRQL